MNSKAFIVELFLLGVILTFLHLPVQVVCKITVISKDKNATVDEINDQPARYVAQSITLYGIEGFIINSNPANSCSEVEPPPKSDGFYPYPDFPAFILLSERFGCDFDTKILNAQNAGYSAIIVHNVGSNSTEAMGTISTHLIIVATFVGEYDGLLLKNNYSDPLKFYIRIQDEFSMSDWLLPFAIGVGICFLVMLVIMIVQQILRWYRERRRSRRRKLPSSVLRRLPTKKWTKSDPYETCVVCIEDFVENDKIRLLPCSHAFHCKCIDPWLTKNRRVCPICKRKVILAGEHFSDSDTDSDDETTPLLGQQTASSSHASVSAVSTSGNQNPQESSDSTQRDINNYNIAHRIQRRFRETRQNYEERRQMNYEERRQRFENENTAGATSNPNNVEEGHDHDHSEDDDVSVGSEELGGLSGERQSVQAQVHVNSISKSIGNVLKRFGIKSSSSSGANNTTTTSDNDRLTHVNENDLDEEHTFELPSPSTTTSTSTSSEEENSSLVETETYIVDNERSRSISSRDGNRNGNRNPTPPAAPAITQTRNQIV